MNRWKIAFFAAFLTILASNAYWYAQIIDVSISYHYLESSYDAQIRRFEALGELVVAGSAEYTQADILHLLRQAQPDANIFEEANKIVFNGIEFSFADGELVEVL